jgi:activating signal cointegrator 1
MKALSLLQPWAQLCVIGAKQFETRSWKANYRGELLIHASQSKRELTSMALNPDSSISQHVHLWFAENNLRPLETYEYSFGAIIGKVTLVNIYHTGEINTPNIFSAHRQLSEHELAFGDYTPGRYAWELTNPVQFENPIPCGGALSIWEFDRDLSLKFTKQKG